MFGGNRWTENVSYTTSTHTITHREPHEKLKASNFNAMTIMMMIHFCVIVLIHILYSLYMYALSSWIVRAVRAVKSCLFSYFVYACLTFIEFTNIQSVLLCYSLRSVHWRAEKKNSQQNGERLVFQNAE